LRRPFAGSDDKISDDPGSIVEVKISDAANDAVNCSDGVTLHIFHAAQHHTPRQKK
jgi:hypothetical protein